MEDITVEDLKKRLDNNEALNLVDVREDWENEEFNIGGKLIPVNQLPGRLDELNGLADSEVIVYCRSGNRSGSAKIFLEKNGFTKVRNLVGGMMEWQRKIS